MKNGAPIGSLDVFRGYNGIHIRQIGFQYPQFGYGLGILIANELQLLFFHSNDQVRLSDHLFIHEPREVIFIVNAVFLQYLSCDRISGCALHIQETGRRNPYFPYAVTLQQTLKNALGHKAAHNVCVTDEEDVHL